MPRQAIAVTSRTYQPGTREFVIPDLMGDEFGLQFELESTSWPAGPIGTLLIAVSDDGVQWTTLVEMPISGGVMLDKTGAEQPRRSVTLFWPRLPDGTPVRLAQVRATVTNTVAIQAAIAVRPL